MLLSVPVGSTSKIIQFPLFDSSSTVGALLAGLVFNSAGLTAYYSREGVTGAAVAITLATATKGTWATGGFVAVDGTNMPGWYELHIPDAALTSGAKSVSIHLRGATNMVPVPILIELTATSNQDAVRGGMTALPASGTLAVNPTLAAVTHTGAVIPTVTAVTNDVGITQAGADKAWSTAARVLTAGTNIALAKGTGVTGFNDLDAAGVAAATWNAATVTYGTAGSYGLLVETNLDATVTSRASPTNITAATGIVLSGVTHTGAVIPTVTTLTGHTAATGDTFARLGAPAGASVSADVAAVKVDTAAVKVKTDFLPSATAGAAGGVFIAGTNAATTITTALTTTFTGNITGSVGSVTGAVGSVTGNVGGNVVGSVASVTARVTANTDQINSVATAAARLALSTQGIVTATVGAASTTTSIVTSALDPAAAVIDQFKGKIITFNQATTTANLRGQSTDITANTALGVLTVTALTTAPVSGDTFVIT